MVSWTQFLTVDVYWKHVTGFTTDVFLVAANFLTNYFLLHCRCMCFGRPLLHAWLLCDLNTIPNNCVGEDSLSSVVMVLAFRTGVPGSNSAQTYLSSICSFVSLLRTLFVRHVRIVVNGTLWKEQLCQYWCEKARKHINASLTAMI